MGDWHPSDRQLGRYLLGGLQEDLKSRITAHILNGCSLCSSAVREQQALQREVSRYATGAGISDSEYAETYNRLLPKLWARECEIANDRNIARSLLSELCKHPQNRRLLMVNNSSRFQTWALTELLLDAGYAQRAKDPIRGLELIELGVAVAGNSDVGSIGVPLANDLKGRAYAFLGNARRVASDLHGAASAFKTAEKYLARGSGDPLESARLWRFRAHLLAVHNDWDQVFPMLDSAIELYRRVGERHLEGALLVDRGAYLGISGDIEGSIRHYEEGLALADVETDPRVVLSASHNLVNSYLEVSRFPEAVALIPETRDLHARLGNVLDMVRFRWLEGKAADGMKNSEEAEEIFREVRQAFAARELALDTAQVSLDLASILLRQGRTAELKDLAAEMLGIFGALRTHRETLAALILFQKAVEVESVTLGLISELAAYLGKAHQKPDLRFRPSPSRTS